MSDTPATSSLPFRLARVFARHAGKIGGGAGIAAAVLQTANRSYTGGAPVVDDMTLSGVFLLASCLACLPADRWPFMKRVSGALGLPYVGYLIADAQGKPGFEGVAAASILPAAMCLSMIFERSAKKPADAAPAQGLVAAFRRAPLLYTAAASVATKALMLSYAVMNRETLFIPAVALLALENVATGMMDNSVRRFFGIGIKNNPQVLFKDSNYKGKNFLT